MKSSFLGPKFRFLAFLLVIPITASNFLTPGPYRVKTDASEILFSASQLGLSRVEGRFKRFSAQIQFDPANPASFTADATIQVGSIDTGNGTRDRNLLGGSFLKVNDYPEIRFRTVEVVANAPGRLRVWGDLTIRGVTKRTEIQVSWFENADKSVRFVGTGKINRNDFGVSGGGFLIGKTVDLTLRILAVPGS